MSPIRMAAIGLKQRAVSSSIAATSVALSGCLLMLVWAFKSEAERTFAAADGGFDAVLGPRGSKLQIVLNALYHLDESPGLMRWEDYERIKGNRAVAAAYPIAVGDNYYGIRLVGTEIEYLQNHEYREGRKFELQGDGRLFEQDALEAVIGSQASRQVGMKVGDTFHPYHGLQFNIDARHEELYTITGVLEPTGTPADRVIWIPIQGIQTMSGHDPNAATDISAVLIKLRPGANMAGFQLDMLYNRRGDRLTFAWPASRSILQFFEKLGWFDQVLQAIAAMVAVIAGAGITAVLYNAMNERQRDIAVWRALGARRQTVFGIAILESLGITISGLTGAFILYAVAGNGIARFIRNEAGVALDIFSSNAAFWWTPIGLLAIGLLAGLAPAFKAYKTDVTKNLI